MDSRSKVVHMAYSRPIQLPDYTFESELLFEGG